MYSSMYWPCLPRKDGRIPKDVLYSELASGAKRVGRPGLRLRVACKRDINLHGAASSPRDRLCGMVCGKKERKKELGEQRLPLHQTVDTCSICNRDYLYINLSTPVAYVTETTVTSTCRHL